jgi:RNA polymerase sigma-70 factor (ECF subfamily)
MRALRAACIAESDPGHRAAIIGRSGRRRGGRLDLADDSTPLFDLATRGDRPAIEELLRRHLPGLRAFIRLRVSPVVRRFESESDLAQSACREVLEHLDKFRYGSESGFRRFLYTAALRKIIDRREYYGAARRDCARVDADAELGRIYQSFSTPSGRAMRREEIEAVERAFDRLEDSQREVISLAHVVGLSRAEMAEHLGKSEGAVRTMLSRALADLAAHLTPA